MPESVPEIILETGQDTAAAPLPTVGDVGSQEVGAARDAARRAVELAAPAAATSPQAPAPARSGGFFAPLRIGGFRLLIGGQTISRVGDQFFFIAIPWLVLRVTHAPLALALVLGASAVTTGLFTLVGGVLADRLGPRALMLGSDVVRFVLMAVLAALAILTTPPLWALIVISALLGIGTGLFYPASQAMVPFLVPREDLQAANSFEQLTMQSSNFIGPGLAGLLLGATQLAFGFVVDAASFAVSVVSLVFVRVTRRTVRDTSAESPGAKPGLAGGLADLGEAFHFLGRTPFLLTLLGISLLGNFALQGMVDVALPLLLKQMVGVADGPRALGIIVSGFGLGSILGVVAAGVAHGIRHKPLVGILLIMPEIGLMAWIPFVGSVYGIAGIFAATGLLLGASNVLFITVIQRFIPIEMMGRMMSIVMLGSFVGGPLSIFAYGAAASLVPQLAWLFVGGAALLAVGCGLALANRQFWAAE